MNRLLWVLCCIFLCLASITENCFAQKHLVYVDLISPLMPSELQEAISAVGKRDFKTAEAILEKIRSANREPKVNVDFVSAVISYEQEDYRSVLTKCFSILEQAPTAIQASDLMCFAAGTKDIPIELQIEALQKSVKCHQDCLLIPPLPVLTNLSDEGIRLANELFSGHPQLQTSNEEANVKIRELLAMLLSEGASKTPKRITLESETLPNTTHHTYTPGGDYAIIYLRPSKGVQYDEALLFEALFELLNIDSKSQFYSLQRSSLSGSVTELEFCTQYAKLEFVNILRARQFYSGRVLPILNQHGVRTAPRNWALGSPGQFKAYMANFRNDDMYPWKNYRKNYHQNFKFGYWHIRSHLPGKDGKAGVTLKGAVERNQN